MEVASRAPTLVAGLAWAAATGGTSCARTAVEMLSKLCLFSSQGYCLALQVGDLDRLCRRVTLSGTSSQSCSLFDSQYHLALQVG